MDSEIKFRPGVLAKKEKHELVPAIEQLIIDHFGYTFGDLRCKSQRPSITYPRRVAIYLVWVKAQYRYRRIARLFDRVIATIPYTIKRMEDLMATDPEIRKEVQYLLSKIEGGRERNIKILI